MANSAFYHKESIFNTEARRRRDANRDCASKDPCLGYGRRRESAQSDDGKVSRNETLRPFRSRFCDSKSPREDFQPSARKLLKVEAYENHIAKCSRPRVRTGIRARFLLWRRRPAPSKQHRPIATRGRDGSGPNSADRSSTGRNLNPTGCKPAHRNAARRSPSGRPRPSGEARDQYQSGQSRSRNG